MTKPTRPSRVAAKGGFRRALMLLLGAVIWPGTPQFLAGRRILGAVVMSIVVALWVVIGVVFFTVRPSRADLIGFVVDPNVLGVGRWILLAAVVAWVLLFLDAWRLSVYTNMGVLRRMGVGLLSVTLIATVSSVGYLGWNTATASRKVITTVFSASVEKPPLEGRYNILLIGSDSGKGRTGMRPDSMNVVSIDANTGATVVISLPRNLQKVPFADGSPMQTVYPYGYNCGTECLLNAVHTAASNRTDLYPDSDDPGMDATIDAIEGVTGLSINYHVAVNMKGFSKLIDAIGGVKMDISEPIAMFGKEDSWKNEYIQPGLQTLNGKQALWYGRSRYGADDYARMGRQKCLLRAIANQISPQTVLLKAAGIAESSSEMLSTDIPASELGAFGDLVLKTRNQQITTLSIVPPLYSTVNPDFDQIRQDVAAAIAQSEREAALNSRPSTTATPSVSPSPTPSSSTSTGPKENSNNTSDLDAVC